ncbi:phosphatidylglycerophosphatase A family protein [Nitratidesulfovibrio vulgaris]|uniref:Phosphatidylglycerophosphatase n=1 Tax=Nitratidesulfovibrio vulgaris (strain ATCC 29579 / DSM 644 / CCUG 34227 / NCIMB 8303 / VKM B-1760 / Hildenborough) TaxID=882 RepID=Q72EP1_NITV2|nr:phosphatidylglycerophosphatase A [Nitratidesulfovibrio vulgaris]AAS95010.1 phosphatidylglycerophosphatase [Nitratidesulfovibrio vulgaris str. Hildenborough]ADP85655.1 phosphatidylglycerophosphatase A [Nitratidesulfovibrio vulgaris RCH1]WCB47228.1 phosphatidylglycerophosphatase A [Nitratidesulfovibrio vulgaris]HBW17092.1 phosphatidylglycerophosphatase A [Desulfovibrio sp.]
MPDSSTRDRVALAIARLGPSGVCPVCPGTCGAAVAAMLAPFVFLPLSLPMRCVALAVVYFIGAWAAGRAEHLLGRKDPGEVVVDELLGQWVTMLPFASLTWPQVLAAFALFRLFDILKPWPVRAAESWLPGGHGVMVDDGVAGLEAMLVLAGLLHFGLL